MPDKKPRVVIVGAGFGGLNAARQFASAPVEVLLIDQNNYHLFQPLLYQVATAMVSPSEIAYPVRSIFRKQENLNFRLTEMTGIDPENQIIQTTTGPIPYDYLILAPGGETNYFNLDSVVKNGIGMKNLDDSIAIRNHILKLFELATQENDPDTCRALRTFVIVGGGPTGVECAGALSELIRLVLIKDFRGMDFSDTRILVIEMSDRLLAGFPANLSEDALHTLQQKHVEVRFGAQVTDYDGTYVRLKDGEEILTSTLIWAAGVRAVSMLDGAGFEQARQGRVVVKPNLQVHGHPEIFAIGDAAYLEADGEALPMVAPVAIQQAKLAARNIQHMLAGQPLEDFQYKDPGSLATIGRNAAVAEVKGLKFHGFIAWLVWLAVHLFWLIGFRNRLLVMLNWAQDYIFYDRAERLITPDGNPKTQDHPWPEKNVTIQEGE